MAITLKEVFDEHFVNVKFDKALAKEIYRYQIGYINRNHEHLEFFGSNLLGVHTVRFKDADVIRLYDEVLDIDYYELVEAIRTVTTINHDFKVSGDVFNLTCMYMLHRFLTSPILGEKERDRASYDMALIFFYRCIAALLSAYFRYPADPKIAQEAYANLSNKYLIKRLGSWHKVMDYRAKDLVGRQSIHYKNLLKFTDDTATVYAINDAQGRIRDLIKNYYAEFKKVHSEGGGIGTTAGTYIDAEGEETTKEKTKSVEAYINYLRHAVVDKQTFIQDELVRIVSKVNTNTSIRMVKATLTWLCDNYSHPSEHKEIDEFIALVGVHSMFLIRHNIGVEHIHDYPYILTNIKNLYLSSRSTDPELDRIRVLGEILIKKANGKINQSLSMATRTSIIMYITLRMLIGTKKH